MPPTVEELYQKLSNGRLPDDKQDFRASKTYSLLQDAFGIWCDHHVPHSEAVEECTRYDHLRSQKDRCVKDGWLLKEFPDLVRMEKANPQDSFKAALTAMLAGAKAIANPYLWDLTQNIHGRANLLIRNDSAPSLLGPYHYELMQFKQALELKEHYILQAVLLNRILGAIQGIEPESVKVRLRSEERVINAPAWKERLDKQLLRWANIVSGELVPDPARPPNAASTPWRVFANKWVYERKDLLLIAGSGWDMRAKLRDAGIKNTDDVVSAGIDRLRELLGDPLCTEYYGNALAYKLATPVIRKEGVWPPRTAARNLYFDFEAADSNCNDERPHNYLIGIWDKEANKYVALLAKGAKEEEKIYKEFIDYAGNPAECALYHWTEHEVRALKDAAGKYPALAEGLRGLISACVDLKDVANKAFYLPTPSFSLKAVAPAFGFNWRQHDCDAMDSMVYYFEWLKGQEEAIGKVLIYNEDDCVAMLKVHDALNAAKPARL